MPCKVEESKIIKVGRGLRMPVVHSHAPSGVSDEIKLGCLAIYQICSQSLSVLRLGTLCQVLMVKMFILMSSLNLSINTLK